MRRFLIIVALSAAVLATPSSASAARGGAPGGGKGTPAITYVWGQLVAADQVDVVVRVRWGSPTYRVTDQFTFYDQGGRLVGSCGGFARLYSGAGSSEWSSQPVAAAVPPGAVRMAVTATLTDKNGRTLDARAGSAPIPDLVGTSMVFWSAAPMRLLDAGR